MTIEVNITKGPWKDTITDFRLSGISYLGENSKLSAADLIAVERAAAESPSTVNELI